MARKRHTRRRHSRRTTHRRRRSGGGGGGAGLALLKHDVPKLVAAGVYGKLESMAAADDNFILNKIPKPLAAVGYTGNVALALYLLSTVVRHPYIKLGASTAAIIASYKIGKAGKLYTSSDKSTIGMAYDGDEVSGGVERIIDQATMGALDAEATEFGQRTPGLPYDSAVQHAEDSV